MSADSIAMAAISALASIDAELGLPEDGCNSIVQTLAAIRALVAERDEWEQHYKDAVKAKRCQGCNELVPHSLQFQCVTCERTFHKSCLFDHCAQDIKALNAERDALREKLRVAVEALTRCNDDLECDDGAHYCPNCDSSMYDLRQSVIKALATIGPVGKL